LLKKEKERKSKDKKTVAYKCKKVTKKIPNNEALQKASFYLPSHHMI